MRVSMGCVMVRNTVKGVLCDEFALEHINICVSILYDVDTYVSTCRLCCFCWCIRRMCTKICLEMTHNVSRILSLCFKNCLHLWKYQSPHHDTQRHNVYNRLHETSFVDNKSFRGAPALNQHVFSQVKHEMVSLQLQNVASVLLNRPTLLHVLQRL